VQIVTLQISGVRVTDALHSAASVLAAGETDWRFKDGIRVRVERLPEGIVIHSWKDGL
jgi:hypothetical protein